LLNHTSGIPDYMPLMDSLWDRSKIANNNDIVTLLSVHKPKILFEPNTKLEYSNTGYALLALIIEKTSGKSYGDYLKINIFKPLKMSNTFVYTRRYSPKKIKNYAFGYVYDDTAKKFVLPDNYEPTKFTIWLDGIVGDGCVNSTVNDLLKWDRALYTNKLISEKSREEIFNTATLKDGTKTAAGFGWFLVDNEYGFQAVHTGGWPGYATIIERNMTHDNTIIILTNHDELPKVFKELRKIINDKLIIQK
jgi:CubicO group peptidase (beta-lactamase class C family)